MKKDVFSIKKSVLSASEVAKMYGFNEHYRFVEFIWCFADLDKELTEADWWEKAHRKYLPHQIAIIEKHFGKPKHKSIPATKFANIYGYARYTYFTSKVLDYTNSGEKLLNELHKYNWDEKCRKVIPIWVKIFVKHLGATPGLDEYLIDDEETKK